MAECKECGGSGYCPQCNGEGRGCSKCLGTGDCTACKGDGIDPRTFERYGKRVQESPMSPEPQPDLALQHYNRGNELLDSDRLDLAIAEYDACLCASPSPYVEMLAWFQLCTGISRKFDWANRDPDLFSYEDIAWGTRAGSCVARTIKIYEQTVVNATPTNEGEADLAKMCVRAHDLARHQSRYFIGMGLSKMVANKAAYDQALMALPPLECLAREEKARSVEQQQSAQTTPKKSGCFIATAAYGSPLAPEVLTFRRFRDEVLLTSKLGSLFVRSYYLASPPLALVISKMRILRVATRYLLLEPILRFLKNIGRS